MLTKEDAWVVLKNAAEEKYKNREYATAIVYYERCLNLGDNDPNIYNMIGFLYKKMAKYQNIEEQIQYFEKAIELNPDFEQAIRNLALAYPLVGRYEEAKKCFLKLFELSKVIDDKMAYAYLCIKTGDFKEGWKYYENRFLRTYGPTEYPKIPDKPKWEGQKILDKTLLVHYEQGFGDSLQFFRYLYKLKPYAKKIIFRVQDELVDLFKNSTKDFEIYGISTPLEDLSFDYHISLMSLPYVLKESVESIPLAKGYIKASEKKIKEYKQKHFANNCLKIGITWNGRRFGNKQRNVPLECFYPLAKLKNVKLYSLQKDFGAKQLENLPEGFEIIDLGKTFNDFSDTAAALKNLDFFITSDNAVFNLAGAMGKKTFLLLNKDAEWRWMLDEENTPWYDSVRIFKKNDENDDWNGLIQRAFEFLN